VVVTVAPERPIAEQTGRPKPCRGRPFVLYGALSRHPRPEGGKRLSQIPLFPVRDRVRPEGCPRDESGRCRRVAAGYFQIIVEWTAAYGDNQTMSSL